MKFQRTPIAIAVLALGGAAPLAAQAAPVVAFTAPAANQVLSGVVSGSACQVSGSGFNKVKFDIISPNGTKIVLNEDIGAPFTCTLDTRQFVDGTYSLRGNAFNGSNVATATRTVVIKNGNTSAPSGGVPTIAFTAPAPGGALSGNVQGPPNCTLTGSNITQVKFYLNNVWINTDGNASNGWGCWLDTTKYPDGSYSVRAEAVNSMGQVAKLTHPVTIKNTNTPPTVALTSPTAGAVISGTAAGYAANAADSGGAVSKVDFYLGSTLVGTKTSSPYNGALDTTKFPNGNHTLKAVATDNQGATASTQSTVSISNTAPGAGAIDAADILSRASADAPFSQQTGYNVQVVGTAPYVTAIPETGVTYSALANGETLRFGKVIDPENSVAKALAIQVHKNDPVTSGAKRAEIRAPDNIEFDKVYWIALSAYIYDWGSLSTSDQALFGMQVHSGNNSLGFSPSIALVTAPNSTGRTFQVFTTWSTSSSPSTGNASSARYATQPIPFGRWVDFVFKFKHNTSGQGFVQVWMDGNQIVNHQGNLGYNTPGYHDYAKFGYYNWSGTSMGTSARKVLMRSPMIVRDPTGSKYTAEQLRAVVNGAPQP